MQKQPERERDSEKAKVRESEKVREQVSEQKLISCSKFFFRWNENSGSRNSSRNNPEK